jgi:hypothetical protein
MYINTHVSYVPVSIATLSIEVCKLFCSLKRKKGLILAVICNQITSNNKVQTTTSSLTIKMVG